MLLYTDKPPKSAKFLDISFAVVTDLEEKTGKKNVKKIFIVAEIILVVAAIVFLALYMNSGRRPKTDTKPDIPELEDRDTGIPYDIPMDPEESEYNYLEGEPEDLGEAETIASAPEGETKPIEDREFTEFWTSYEEFMTQYASVIYNPDDPSYTKTTEDFLRYTEKADAYENDKTLTDQEIQYMTEAQARIAAIYAEASLE